MALGVTSVTVAELISSFHDDFDIRLHPGEFFEHPSLDALVAYLSNEVGRN